MEVIRAAADLAETAEDRRAAGDSLGFVATMGALHAGHLSLIARARAENDVIVVSIFVNPLQFAAGEDLARYPRDEAADLERCRSAAVDLVWVPTVDEVYPPGADLPSPEPGPVGDTFEGAARPDHFAGVLKVVHRLLTVIGPSTVYFGEKDAQQLFLVRRMVETMALPNTVVACPIDREPDGLARSSRNSYLAEAEREQAPCLFLALSEAAMLVRKREREVAVLVAAMAREIGGSPPAMLDYAAVVDDATFQPVETISAPARALVAARFPSARLIDNLLLPSPA